MKYPLNNPISMFTRRMTNTEFTIDWKARCLATVSLRSDKLSERSKAAPNFRSYFVAKLITATAIGTQLELRIVLYSSDLKS